MGEEANHNCWKALHHEELVGPVGRVSRRVGSAGPPRQVARNRLRVQSLRKQPPKCHHDVSPGELFSNSGGGGTTQEVLCPRRGTADKVTTRKEDLAREEFGPATIDEQPCSDKVWMPHRGTQHPNSFTMCGNVCTTRHSGSRVRHLSDALEGIAHTRLNASCIPNVRDRAYLRSSSCKAACTAPTLSGLERM